MGLKILNQTIIDDSKNFNLSECIFSDGTKFSSVNKPLTLLNFYSLQLLNALNNPNAYSTSLGDNFGYSVAISGDKCIVGAYAEDDTSGTGSGKAYIFDVTTGALLFTLNNSNAYSTSASDYFGSSVAISGDKCIVGAYAEDDLGGSDSGKAYIFDVNQSYVYKRRITNVDSISFSNISVDDKLLSTYKSSTYFDKLIQLGVSKYGI